MKKRDVAILVALVIIIIGQAAIIFFFRDSIFSTLPPFAKINYEAIGQQAGNQTSVDDNIESNINSESDWWDKYPQLAFLHAPRTVTVVPGNDENTVFALDKIQPDYKTGPGEYKIWMVSRPDTWRQTVIESGEAGECSDINIRAEGDYLVSDSWKSPCEAGRDNTLTYYDIRTGKKTYRFEYSEGAFVGAASASYFDADGEHGLSIGLAFDGVCDNAAYLRTNANVPPSISFTGVNISRNNGLKSFYQASDKIIDTECQGAAYGEGIMTPGIDKAGLVDGKFVFSAPFQIRITLDPSNPDMPPVFERTAQ